MIDPAPWANRVHAGPRAAASPMTAEQRETVLAALRPAKTELRVAKRPQALLLMAAGVGPADIVRLLGVHPRMVENWKARFAGAEDMAAELADAPRSGRPR